MTNFTFSIYGPQMLNFLESECTLNHQQFFNELLLQKILLNFSDFQNFASLGQPNVFFHFNHCHDGIGTFYFRNDEIDVMTNVCIKIKSFEGCRLCIILFYIKWETWKKFLRMERVLKWSSLFVLDLMILDIILKWI